MTYHAAYAASMILPARNSRVKRDRARRFAAKAEANAQKHAPAGIAVAVNLFVLGFLGSVTIRRSESKRAEMEATIESFVTPTITPPSGGGGGGSSALDSVVNQAASVAIQMVPPAPTMSSVTSTAPSALSFVAPAIPQVTGIPDSVKEVQERRNKAFASMEAARKAEAARNANTQGTSSQNTGTGTGQGPGEGTGTGPGTGSGNGGGNGSGQGPGTGVGNFREGKGHGSRIGRFDIEASKLGVIVDISDSMGPQSHTARRQAENYNNAIIIDQGGCMVGTYEVFDPTHFTEGVTFLINQGADAIFWLCDLEDAQTDDGLNRLEEILMENHVKLYISTWGKEPSPRLLEIVRKSGGSVEIKGRPCG